MSQLELALHAHVTPRHVSFVETGRANPSREMVLTLARALDVPLRERNRLLLAAGWRRAMRRRTARASSTSPRWHRCARRSSG
jgi:transcriptional regulator with XRE-family HTH domain